MTAGLEAATDRLLAAMKKGITVDQVVRVAAAFHGAGILVHAYLMYGYPGETVAETIESLERVRQLFASNLIQSAFWHRFVATAHSPIGLRPEAHGIRVTGPQFNGFAENDFSHDDGTGAAEPWVGQGLRAALFNYCEGRGLATSVGRWFERPVPRPRVPRDWVPTVLKDCLGRDNPTAERHFTWIGSTPVLEALTRSRAKVILPNRTADTEIRLPMAKAVWLKELIDAATPIREKATSYPLLRDVREEYPFGSQRGFDRFMASVVWGKVRQAGLLLV